jgi:hypothetical protein
VDLEPSSRQTELIALAPRAERHDREASFPFDDYADRVAEACSAG